jgi:4-aminobutyrate aminotransferase
VLRSELADRLRGLPAVSEVRGVGLMIGVELATPEIAHAIADLCFRRGLLVLECGSKAIRFSPPLIITEAQARTSAELFAAVCKEASARA